jgi:protein phosphatase
MALRIRIAAASDRGQIRAQNQDFHAYRVPDQGCLDDRGILLAVADGMGGHAGGQEASRIAVQTLMSAYYRASELSILESLEQAVIHANLTVKARAAQDPALRGMGSTLTALVLQHQGVCYAHVGDSRGYLIHNGRMIQFTRDHSLVADLVGAGIISPRDAARHPDRNIITRAIGMEADLKVDVARLPHRLQPGQIYLLCCDGLHGQLNPEEIQEGLTRGEDLDDACRHLVDLANARGGPDNITVLAARVDRSGIFSRWRSGA